MSRPPRAYSSATPVSEVVGGGGAQTNCAPTNCAPTRTEGVRADDERAAGDGADLAAGDDDAVLRLRRLEVDDRVCPLPEQRDGQTAVRLDRKVVDPAEQPLGARRQRRAVVAVQPERRRLEADGDRDEDERVRAADDGEEAVALDEVDDLVVREEHGGHDEEREHLRLRLVLEADERREDRVLERAHHPVDADDEAEQRREVRRLHELLVLQLAVERGDDLGANAHRLNCAVACACDRRLLPGLQTPRRRPARRGAR